MQALKMKIKRRTYHPATLAEASSIYCTLRDESGEGASTFRETEVVDQDGKFVARISYNGRVWANREWTSGEQPILEAAHHHPIKITSLLQNARAS